MEKLNKIMLSVPEFAEISGIGMRRVRELVYVTGFPAMKNGRKVLIHAERANEWLAEYAAHDMDGLSSVRI